MRFPRSSGILLHPTSLPGPYGIGEIGKSALEFVDFLASAGQKIWQVLPLNPTGYGDSPYQSFSAFAGNPLLISLDSLRDEGLLSGADLAPARRERQDSVDYGAVIEQKSVLLSKAADLFSQSASASSRRAFDAFCLENAGWLEDFALFMAAKHAHCGVVWTKWPPELVHRNPDTLALWRERLSAEISAIKFWQFEFFRQWHALKNYCRARGIRIMGDMPIYVAHDSSDVWANPHLFWLDDAGNPLKVAGVPPDYFSATGQLWGNPIYRWDVVKQDGYAWWISRFRAALDLYDQVRLDHFRGFEAYWEIPAGEPTAIKGEWIKGPGAELFSAIERVLGPLPLVAENLGVITAEVEALRNQFGFPGMAILQFAFGIDAQAPSFRPHNYEPNQVAYTGGHDNDTAVGWWTGGAGDSIRTAADVAREHAFAKAYLGITDESLRHEPINWVLIRHVMMSVADTAMTTMQDVLGLGTEARMNIPGTLGRNWKWRYRADALKPELAEKLNKLCKLYDR